MEVQNPINTTHILKAIIQCQKKKKLKNITEASVLLAS